LRPADEVATLDGLDEDEAALYEPRDGGGYRLHPYARQKLGELRAEMIRSLDEAEAEAEAEALVEKNEAMTDKL